MAMMTVASKHLPDDIVTDILTRLPLKSLVRFRCVSKPWLNFLTHSRFPYWLLFRHLHCDTLKDCPHNESSIFLFYNKSSNSRPSRRREVQASDQSRDDQCKLYALGGGFLENSFKFAFEIDFPLIRGKSFEIKTGSCHGMFCLSMDGDHNYGDDANSNSNTLVLWNPSIHDYKILPLPQELGVCAGVCGLGFDSSMEDYKVVSVCDKQVHVFSVKRNLWRNLGGFDYSVFYEAIPLNGCLYWGASKFHKFADRILCFNLSDETFREVPSPPFEPIIPQSIWFYEQFTEQQFFVVATELNLLLWGNSLCVFRQYDQTLWKMKQEKEENDGGVKETWSLLMTLPKITNHESHLRNHYRLHPKCFTKSGKLVLSVRRKRFVMYDGVKFEDLHVQGMGEGRFLKAAAYSESLISPASIRGMNDID
ncbi:F-box/kelch-repeat protein At3g23880 [Ricinus communis]|uniref:F-box domain-containing protein n=1 Tax=Ricinus communis TaxID=3988 RepID=B9RTY4_RICCO|nr:F-box/kelch-repeat protein At3g23880 [Ricinus communis]EEF45366.1 hypothetical protein RCOM_0913810 [Ricinus communis]|eukprot:XP_002517203.1 F-box/kelch-repeat protein At3g23880 [Ricinus communis]